MRYSNPFSTPGSKMLFLQLLVSVGSLACSVATALRIEVPDDVLRRQDCKNPCGFGGWLCCPSGTRCFTDAANQAQCDVSPAEDTTTQNLPTPPRPASTAPLPTPPRPATAVPDTSSTRVSLPSETSSRSRSSTSSLRTSNRASQSMFPIPSGDQSPDHSSATETKPSTSTHSVPSPQNGLSSGVIAGAALGAIFGVGLIVLGMFFLFKRRARALNAEQATGYGADLPVACGVGQQARGASKLAVVDKTPRVDGRGFGRSTLPIAELDGRKAG